MAILTPVLPKTFNLGAASAAVRFAIPEVYTNATRPLPGVFPPGKMIFNTSDEAPNWVNSTSTQWVDAMGAIT